jgi:hypothetical protein
VADVARKPLTLWLVALVCLGPFALAIILYYGPWRHDWLPRLPGSRELVEPPIALPAEWLAATADAAPASYPWSLIYVRITPCEQPCIEHLGRLRQVQLAVGRDLDRVQRVFLHTDDAPRTPNDGPILVRRLDGERGAALVGALGAQRLEEGRIYIADPGGNLVAGYPPDVEQRELLRDLQRLLSVSRTR